MEKSNCQPMVYVAREIYIYDESGNSCEVANFVSKAYLRKLITTYNEDGSLDQEYFVDLTQDNFNAEKDVIFYIQEGKNLQVSHIFKDYKSCRKYVDQINKSLSMSFDVYNFPLSLYTQKNVIYDNAVRLGNMLEEKYISFKDRNIKSDTKVNNDEFLDK